MLTFDARLAALPSPDLLAALDRTAALGREVTADLIALLAECDARQLYATEGYPSLFDFCVARLRLSEAQAYHRIQAARAVRRFPLVLERLREGRVSLTGVALLREHLTEANHREVLDWADGRRKREVEEFVRRLDPHPDAAPSLRRLAAPRAPLPLAVAAEHPGAAQPNETGSFVHAPVLPEPRAARADVRPSAPTRYSLRVTISEETADKLRRAQALLGRVLPNADPAVVLDRALTLLLAQLERRKAGAPRTTAEGGTRPKAVRSAQHGAASRAPARVGAVREDARERPSATATTSTPPPPSRPPAATIRSRRSRYLPAAVRRTVWDRDGGRCAYVASSGIRCTATTTLEFHHRVPFAEGGSSTVENLSLACSRHNAVEAARWFNFDRAEFAGGAPEP